MSTDHSHGAECDTHDCFASPDRREFLRSSFLSVASALIAVGATSQAAFAMPMAFVEALHSSGSRHSYAIPAVDGAQIDKDNQVILVRWQNAIYAFSLSCPHQNTALRWDDREHTFECPKHHSRFTAFGSYIPGSGRATRDMDRLPIQLDGTALTVDVDTVYQEDTDRPRWAAAVVKMK